jgi:P-type Cu+ transporter
MRTHSKENAASDAASVVLLGNRLSQVRFFPVMFLSLSNSTQVPLTGIKQSPVQVVDALSLSKATMAKVHQNLAWAVAYNIVAIPIAAGVLLPQYDFAMTPSLSGNVY